MTKEELKRIPEIIKLIKIKEKQLEELSEISVCVPALNTNEKVQSSIISNGFPVSDKKLDLERQLNNDIAKLFELMNEAYKLFSMLPYEDRLLMEARYIRGLSWREVCEEIKYSWRSAHRHHKRILKVLFPN